MKKKSFILVILFWLGCLALGIYNGIKNPDFLVTPLSTIISIGVAVVVSYFFVQRKTDDRRKKEKIDKLLYKVQEIILNDNFIEVRDENLIIQRSVINKILYLEDGVDNDIKGDISRIREKFEEFREFYGNHYKDIAYMNKSKKELLNYVRLIDDFCDKIHMKLL